MLKYEKIKETWIKIENNKYSNEKINNFDNIL